MIRRTSSRGRSGGGIRLLVALAFAAFAIISYLGSQEFNPVTGENQYVSLTKQQEIQLGLQSVPEMLQQFGPPYSDEDVQNYLDDVGFLLVNNSVAADTGWEWDFTLINNPELINAFALPGGQVFITTALFSEFENEAQLAGVLSHEIVHVLARHSSQQIAKQELTQGLIGAVAIGSEDANAAQVAAVVGQLVNMSYGRDAETQSDLIGVEIMSDTGYDPRAMV
ncbi:MAG: M48 family metalloprotease, partial [Anaerolineae bacterium]|nr:M48 family metalloprotease [Anaerolineae bacterium]